MAISIYEINVLLCIAFSLSAGLEVIHSISRLLVALLETLYKYLINKSNVNISLF